RENGGDFGGEASGSWIFPGVSYCPDGIYAAAQIAAIASVHRMSDLVDSIPSYPLLRGSISSEGVGLDMMEKKLQELAPQSVANTDGIKLIFSDGWLLVRASGTEPKIRLTAEAKTEARVQELYERGLKAIQDCARAKGKTS
ncbi:phosphoglucosamine mutase, partial [Chloroflexota bacterium]